MRRMNKEERKSLEREISSYLGLATTSEYGRYILKSCDPDDEEESTTIMDEIIDDVLTSSAWEDEGYYNDDDIRLAIGRVIMRRIGIDV